jgi:hypothetical protein
VTHAQTVTNLMDATSSDDPLVLEAWLTDTLDAEHKVPMGDALRIALLQLEGTRNAVLYLAEQMDILDPTVR